VRGAATAWSLPQASIRGTQLAEPPVPATDPLRPRRHSGRRARRAAWPCLVQASDSGHLPAALVEALHACSSRSWLEASQSLSSSSRAGSKRRSSSSALGANCAASLVIVGTASKATSPRRAGFHAPDLVDLDARSRPSPRLRRCVKPAQALLRVSQVEESLRCDFVVAIFTMRQLRRMYSCISP